MFNWSSHTQWTQQNGLLVVNICSYCQCFPHDERLVQTFNQALRRLHLVGGGCGGSTVCTDVSTHGFDPRGIQPLTCSNNEDASLCWAAESAFYQGGLCPRDRRAVTVRAVEAGGHRPDPWHLREEAKWKLAERQNGPGMGTMPSSQPLASQADLSTPLFY